MYFYLEVDGMGKRQGLPGKFQFPISNCLLAVCYICTSITMWKNIVFQKDFPRKPSLPPISYKFLTSIIPPARKFSQYGISFPLFFLLQSLTFLSSFTIVLHLPLCPSHAPHTSNWPPTQVNSSPSITPPSHLKAFSSTLQCHPCVPCHCISWFILCFLGPIRVSHFLKNLVKVMDPENHILANFYTMSILYILNPLL